MGFVSGIGMLNVDLLYSGMERIPNEGEELFSKGFDVQLGGGMPATLINLARLGIPTEFCTFLGKDIFSNFIKEQLEHYSAKYHNLYRGNGTPLTITSIVTTKSDRTFISYCDDSCLNEVGNDEIYQNLKGSKIVDMQIGFLEVYKKLKKDGAKLVFDMGWDDDMSLEKYSEYLELADYYTPNQKEALRITNTSNVQDAADKLKRYFKQVVIKLDKDGCFYTDGEAAYIVPPLDNVVAVDSTGAGDAFLSGFIYGLYHDYDIESAIRFGNITGGTCVQGIGCLTKYVNEQELLEIAKSCREKIILN